MPGTGLTFPQTSLAQAIQQHVHVLILGEYAFLALEQAGEKSGAKLFNLSRWVRSNASSPTSAA